MNVFFNCRLFDASLHCLQDTDVVHERSGLYRVGVSMACRRLKLPHVVFFDADPILESDFLGRPIHGLLRWRARQTLAYTLAAADCVICVSQAARSHLIGSWGVPDAKIVVMPNGVDTEQFRPYPHARTDMRASLGVGDRQLIVFVGTFFRWHDISTLLRAFAHIWTANKSVCLALVGDGEQRQAAEAYAADLGIGDGVIFTGKWPHDTVARVISAADVAVAPYPKTDVEFWGSPMKIFEYMSAGVAVVASAVGQLAEVIEDGVNGLLVAPGDHVALGEAINRLLLDPALRERLGQEARRDAVRSHSWEQYLEKLECVYLQTIEQVRRLNFTRRNGPAHSICRS